MYKNGLIANSIALICAPVSGVTKGDRMRVREKVSERNTENKKNMVEKNNTQFLLMSINSEDMYI